MNSPFRLHLHLKQQRFSRIFLTSLVLHNKFYEYSTVKDNNEALKTESLE